MRPPPIRPGNSGQVIRSDDAVAHGTNEIPPALTFDAAPPVKPDASSTYPVAMPGTIKACYIT